MRAGFVPAPPIGTRAGETGVAGANPMWVLFWFDTFKPAVDQWVMFRAKMLGLDRTVAANYIAYADRWAADWGEFVAWRDRLIKLRTIAKTFGMKLTKPRTSAARDYARRRCRRPDQEDRWSGCRRQGGRRKRLRRSRSWAASGSGAIFLGTQPLRPRSSPSLHGGVSERPLSFRMLPGFVAREHHDRRCYVAASSSGRAAACSGRRFRPEVYRRCRASAPRLPTPTLGAVDRASRTRTCSVHASSGPVCRSGYLCARGRSIRRNTEARARDDGSASRRGTEAPRPDAAA